LSELYWNGLTIENFAGDGCDGDIAIAFAGKKFPTPLARRGIASAAHDGVSSLDEEMADVSASASSDPQADVFAFAALALAGVESDVVHEFLGTVGAPDLANDGQQGNALTMPTPRTFMQRIIVGSTAISAAMRR
jgi:hypothetical protein